MTAAILQSVQHPDSCIVAGAGDLGNDRAIVRFPGDNHLHVTNLSEARTIQLAFAQGGATKATRAIADINLQHLKAGQAALLSVEIGGAR